MMASTPVCITVQLFYDVESEAEAAILAADHVEGMMMEHGGTIEAVRVLPGGYRVRAATWLTDAVSADGRYADEAQP